MTTENVIALVAVLLAVFGQFGVVCYYAGKMNSRMTAEEERTDTLESDLDRLGNKLDKEFVSKGRCDGINKQWAITVKSLLEQRDMYNEQNSKEHNALLLQGKEIVKCLNLIQSDERCL